MTKSINILNFTPWGEARDTLKNIIQEGKLDIFEALLNECYTTISNIELNDLLAYHTSWIYEELEIEY